MKFTGIFQQLIKNITNNSPTILTGLSVAGLIATTVMAVKATPKAFQMIKDEEYELNQIREDGTWPSKITRLTKLEVIQLTWKCYVPSAIMGGVTIACVIGANSINLKRNAALAGLYSLTETTLKEYQAKVVETLGENKAREIKSSIDSDRIKNNPPTNSEIIITGNGSVLCYDCSSGRYFKNDVEQIRRIQNDFNNELLTGCGGTVTLNEVYYALGLKGTQTGDKLGWSIETGLIEFKFSSQLTDEGIPCLVIDYTVVPMYEY